MTNTNILHARIPVSICCAVTDELVGEEALISSGDFDSLMSAPSAVTLNVYRVTRPDWLVVDHTADDLVNEGDCMYINKVSSAKPGGVDGQNSNLSSSTILTSQEILRTEGAKKFRDAQKDDTTLNYCWISLNKNETFYELNKENNLLYHLKVISGVRTKQLVIPVQYRTSLFEAAHDSQWSMHFGVRKTIMRIEAHFFGQH